MFWKNHWAILRFEVRKLNFFLFTEYVSFPFVQKLIKIHEECQRMWWLWSMMMITNENEGKKKRLLFGGHDSLFILLSCSINVFALVEAWIAFYNTFLNVISCSANYPTWARGCNATFFWYKPDKYEMFTLNVWWC